MYAYTSMLFFLISLALCLKTIKPVKVSIIKITNSPHQYKKALSQFYHKKDL